MSSAQLSPVGPPLPPGAGRDSGGARRARPPAPPPPEPRRWSGHSSPPPLHACPGAAGRARGVPSWNGAGTGVLVQDWDARALGRGGAGTRDEVHRPEAGVGEGEGRPWSGPGAGLAVRLSKQAGPEARPEPLPAPCAPPGPPLRAHTHSRVCLARERCPWLHNSPDGIRPSVFLNRAERKKCELSVGRGSRPPA